MSTLQPLDVCMNKPFKDYIIKLYTELMVDGEHSFTKTGKIQRSSMETRCFLIVKAWDLTLSDITKKVLRKLVLFPVQ